LHRQAYSALVQGVPVPPGPEASPQPADLSLLARLVAHAEAGQLWEAAVHWARAAAAVAERAFAIPTAVEYLNTARRCLAQLPPSETGHLQLLEIELKAVRIDRWSSPAERDARLAHALRLAHQIGAVSYIPRLRIAQAESLILQGRCREAAALLDQLAPLAARDPRLAMAFHVW